MAKIVEFMPDRIGRFPEFISQSPQMGVGMAVQEEPEEHSDAGAGGDEVFKHRTNV